MTDREIMQMALDALEHGLPIIKDFGGKEQLQIQHKAISALYEALRAALAQPEKEWVSLTDKEILADDVLRYHFALNGGAGPISKKGMAVIAAVNAKLKEKNSV